LSDPELHPDSPFKAWPDNRIAEDAGYMYRHDVFGRLTEKTDRIPEGVNRIYDGRRHCYEYDNQHRLVHYRRTQYDKTQAEGRYIYDPPGRRIAKQVWKREHQAHEQMALSRRPYTTWYGWEGDRLTTVQTEKVRVQTVYQPGSFTPLLRIETNMAELEKTHHRSLAEILQQDGSGDGHGVVFPAELVQMLNGLEAEIRGDQVSDYSRAWLAGCGLTVEQMAAQLEPEYEPERRIHLYHCDHRGLPLALFCEDGSIVWSAEFDEWENLLSEDNPQNLQQLIRLPGQQYDDESGLYYNRHRYYNPEQGRYITQDPIKLLGGWNLYQYPLNPVSKIDPLGLSAWDDAKSGTCTEGICQLFTPFIGPEKFSDPDIAAFDALKKINVRSICEEREYAGLICKDNHGKYFSTAPKPGMRKSSYPFESPCPDGSLQISAYHTHGADSHGEYWDEIFSAADEALVKSKGNKIEKFYLGTPDGAFKAINNKAEITIDKKGLPNACRIHGDM